MVNVFPMDLIGPKGVRHFPLVLHCTSAAVPLMERWRRIVLSNVPLDQASVAFGLVRNHKTPCIDVDQLPFATARFTAFGSPVRPSSQGDAHRNRSLPGEVISYSWRLLGTTNGKPTGCVAFCVRILSSLEEPNARMIP